MTQDKPITVTYCTCSHPNTAHPNGPCLGVDGWPGVNNWNCPCQAFERDKAVPPVKQYALKEVE